MEDIAGLLSAVLGLGALLEVGTMQRCQIVDSCLTRCLEFRALKCEYGFPADRVKESEGSLVICNSSLASSFFIKVRLIVS